MNFKEIYQSWKLGNQVAGIRVFIVSDEDYRMDILWLEKRKGEIRKTEFTEGIGSWETLLEKTGKKMPLALVIEGKGVIHKKLQPDEEQPVITQILPNAREEDFYVQQTPSDAGNVYVSLIRKEQLDSLLHAFVSKGMIPVSVGLGPFSVQNFIPLFTGNPNQLHTGEAVLSIHSEAIVDILPAKDKDPGHVDVSGEMLSSGEVVPFCAALAYFVPGAGSGKMQEGPITEYRGEFFYKRAINLSIRAALAVIFGILLVNFFFFDHYNKKYNRLSAELGQNRELLQELEQLKADVAFREEFILRNGLQQQTKHSYYADRIATLLPKPVILQKMVFNPLSGKIKEGEEMIYNREMITLSGITRDVSRLNEWIALLKKEAWAKSVTLLSYRNEEKENPGEFRLEIEVNN